jgi:shikimate kinase
LGNSSLNKKNIVLMGFMGSGKSQVGRALSFELDRVLLDTDNLIEKKENREIFQIFETDGESYFREQEKKVGNWLKSSVSNSVIALGGGFPTVVSNLSEIGLVIYLDIDFDFMMSEMKKYKDEFVKRPNLRDEEKARQLYLQRKEIYTRESDIRFEVKYPISNLVSEINSYIKQNNF